MSGGKKRSGFQITSVTSEVGESPASKIPVTQDVSDSPPTICDGLLRDSAHYRDQTTPSSILLNGPAFLHTLSPTLLTQQSSSQPATPVTMRKQRSLDQAVTGGGASRFRVVRLGQGLGEPYKRGRWTCVDVMEREPELLGVRRVMDSMRHAHSLESLETVGLGGAEGESRLTLKSLKDLRASHMVHSQGSAHLMAHSGPPSPTHPEYETHLLSPPLHTANTPCTRKIPPPLHLNMGGVNKLRTTCSQPTSPGPPVSRDGLFHPSLTPIQTPSALALAQSMFGVGGAFRLVSDESVKKMVSAFETRKQPHPPPSHSSPSSSTQNPSPNQQSPPPSTTPTPGERRHHGERDRQDVVLRGGGEGRRTPRVRLRDSWPMGMLNCFERNFLSFVAVETKEPIRCSKCPPEFDRSRLRSIRGKSTSSTDLNTSTTTKELNTSTTTKEFNTSTTTKELNTSTTTRELNTSTTTKEFNTSTTTKELNTSTTTKELNTSTTTKELNTSTITEPKSTIGTNDSSAISTTASGTRGTCSRFTTQSSSKLITGANANANSNSELLLPLELRGPVLVGGANKSVFEPPGVPMYPKQPVLGNVAGTQSGGRDQGKGRAFQTLIGLHPSDSSFLSLLLLLRSGSSNSMIAIDNKIEQAMDLVKAHLMLAVREEVDVLREQIKELAERNAQLERENYILRALRENH